MGSDCHKLSRMSRSSGILHAERTLASYEYRTVWLPLSTPTCADSGLTSSPKYLPERSGAQEWSSACRFARYIIHWRRKIKISSLTNRKGYTDINLARVRKAEHYLLRCQEVFIVARIDRVLSDQSVATFVENQMKASGKRVSVTIVCTHADVRHFNILSCDSH